MSPRTRLNRTIRPARAVHSFDSAGVLLAAHRLLDSLQARPHSRAEFEEAARRATESVRIALDPVPARRGGIARASLRVAGRLGHALRAASPRKSRARLSADLLSLPRRCRRSACRKAQRCHSAPRACLRRAAHRVPEIVGKAFEALAERLERGDTLELAVALMPFESKMALWAWQRAQTGA